MSEKLTAQQRANLFAMSTRQNLHMMAKQTVTSPSTSMQFTLPKSRLLANIFVNIKAKVKVTHASATTLAMDNLSPYRLVRRFSLDLNNGFAPFAISGDGLALLNMIQPNANMLLENTAYRNVPESLKASATGAENEIMFTVQLPCTLNNRDIPGMVLLQSDSTVCDLRIDVGNPVEMIAGGAEGYTMELVSLEALPMLETFSIPANSNAFPDLSVLKLCQDRTDTITSAGQQIVKLSTGQIYRKLVLYIEDENGQPIDADFVQSNISLVFNQADTNYDINPVMLRAKNAYDLGHDVPKGVFIFDFTNQGLPNYGGTRDYIDSANLTEFWVRFNTGGKGRVKIISETLARLV